ncbi:membrane hypothetical protein [Vibrio coralliirubri]|nr:membrane hypothetical protein [Vibrio coralliirubri]
MECVDTSFISSLIVPSVLILLIAKLRSDNHLRPFLTELYSPPILLSGILAIIFTFFFYEPLPAPETKTIGGLFSRPVHFIESLTCSFITMFNILSYILPVVTIYTFLENNNPELISSMKSKIRELFW